MICKEQNCTPEATMETEIKAVATTKVIFVMIDPSVLDTNYPV